MFSEGFGVFTEWRRKNSDGLTLEERGLYAEIMMAMSKRGCPVPDDAGWASKEFACSENEWNNLRHLLIQKGKIKASWRGGVRVISIPGWLEFLRGREN